MACIPGQLTFVTSFLIFQVIADWKWTVCQGYHKKISDKKEASAEDLLNNPIDKVDGRVPNGKKIEAKKKSMPGMLNNCIDKINKDDKFQMITKAKEYGTTSSENDSIWDD